MKKKIVSLMLIITMIMSSSMTLQNVHAEETVNRNILLNGKEILYFFFYTKNNNIEASLKDELNLTDESISEIKDVALMQFNDDNKTKAEFKGKTTKEDVSSFNTTILNESALVNEKVKDILGGKYNKFIVWLSNDWNNACQDRKSSSMISTMDISSDDADIEVWATQFNTNDGNDFEVALPDQQLKAENANLGYAAYTVNVISYNRGTSVSDVPVYDVGPWNENDNYWSNNRREFPDLELSYPEAEAAFFDNYDNGSCDTDQIVTNPAGIDLSRAVAAQLGFGEYESGWISIHLNF